MLDKKTKENKDEKRSKQEDKKISIEEKRDNTKRKWK